jgi:hypothetical protein
VILPEEDVNLVYESSSSDKPVIYALKGPRSTSKKASFKFTATATETDVVSSY